MKSHLVLAVAERLPPRHALYPSLETPASEACWPLRAGRPPPVWGMARPADAQRPPSAPSGVNHPLLRQMRPAQSRTNGAFGNAALLETANGLSRTCGYGMSRPGVTNQAACRASQERRVRSAAPRRRRRRRTRCRSLGRRRGADAPSPTRCARRLCHASLNLDHACSQASCVCGSNMTQRTSSGSGFARRKSRTVVRAISAASTSGYP